MDKIEGLKTENSSHQSKTLKWILALLTAAIFLFIYSSINTGLSAGLGIVAVIGLSSIAILFLYVILAIAGLFLGFLAQLIIYKAIKLESKSFFYILLAVVVIAAPVRTFLMLYRDIPTLTQTLDLAGATLSKALLFAPLIYTISFLLPFFLRQRKIVKEKLKPLIAIFIGVIVEYLILAALKAI